MNQIKELKTHSVMLRVTEPTWETLSKMASDNGTTISAVIRFLLTKGVEATKKS